MPTGGPSTQHIGCASVPVGGHISIAARASEGFQRSPLVQMKAESEYFKLTYHNIWICISRYGLDTNKAP
jgi:hypothetical protein